MRWSRLCDDALWECRVHNYRGPNLHEESLPIVKELSQYGEVFVLAVEDDYPYNARTVGWNVGVYKPEKGCCWFRGRYQVDLLKETLERLRKEEKEG